MDTFLNEEELKKLGLKSYGKNVKIGKHVILYSPEKLSVGNNVRIDDFTVISGNVTIGSYVHISHFCGLYGGSEGIKISDFAGLSSRVCIYATSDDYSGNSLTNPMTPMCYKPGYVDGKVEIGRHSIVGSNSVILPNVSIGEGVAVGSMSLCTKSLEPWSIYVGAPVKRIKERSHKLEEFERLLLESNGDD